jgi:hypothetical protein
MVLRAMMMCDGGVRWWCAMVVCDDGVCVSKLFLLLLFIFMSHACILFDTPTLSIQIKHMIHWGGWGWD